MSYKFKYLIFREKPYNKGETVAQVNVSHLNKKGIKERWDGLLELYPLDKYQSSLTECNEQMAEFISTVTVPSEGMLEVRKILENLEKSGHQEIEQVRNDIHCLRRTLEILGEL